MNILKNYILAGLSFSIITLLAWGLRETLTLANFAMIYILVVLIIAIRLGTQAAMGTAFISFLSINFFLTRPYYTFIVADTRDIIELVVFIIIAALSGQLGARARHEAEVSSQRAYEQEILYRLAGAMNQLVDKEAIYETLIDILHEDLHAGEVHIVANDSLAQANNETSHTFHLQAGSRTYGTLQVNSTQPLSSQQIRLFRICMAQSTMALQRIELTERARVSQQYEEADRLKTAILQAVSHDLRTPITIIKTSASNLRTLGTRLSPTQQQELFETIESEADHLNKLIGNLLDLSRLQAGEMKLNSELNSLEEVVGDVTARIWQSIGSERIKAIFPDDMPLVSFDYGLMLQAITNLVDNGLRYEPPESQLEIHGYLKKDGVQLKIINHGETIAHTEREHIMRPFYHGKDGHIGLGLPIAKGIIEAHHGTLTLEDTCGGGATFVLELPFAKKEVN